MHRLHLLRHAKSSADEGGDDLARPLSQRGRAAARRVGQTLPAALGRIDLVLCSTALRTRETAELALAGFAPLPHIAFEEGLYLAGRNALLRRLRALDEAVGAVMVIGHNPGLHDLALALSPADSPSGRALGAGKFPTGARASFALDGKWASLDRTHCALIDYVTPKSLGAED